MAATEPLFSVCVFCGSRDGNDPKYLEDAKNLGGALGRRGMRLVYGAGDVGIMGAVAKAAQEAGAQTLGIIPTHLMQLEVAKRDLGALIITENMHERKKVMFMNSDAVVVLPGGAGSLDEFFEVLTWAQLGLHEKPVILVNTNGYWDKLVDLIDHVIESGFASPSLKAHFHTVDSVEAALSVITDAQVG